MRKVFVTDGRSLATLAIVRSLGKQGFEVHCGEEFYNNITFFSKYITRRIIYPPPERQPAQFITRILNLIREENYDMIIPVRDECTLILSQYKQNLLKYTKIYLSNFDAIKKFRDKGETIKIAQKYRVPVPLTYFPENTDIKEIKRDISYPALIRPRISSGARGIEYINSPNEFDSAYEKVKIAFGEPIVQEYINHNGGHFSIGTIFDSSSNPVAVHVYKEIKQYPINGGPAVTAISVEKEEWVNKILNILKSIKWIGPAHMDVLYDPLTDTHRLLEVNPRFWMSLNLGIKSGIDFPLILYKLAMGEEPPVADNYIIGLKYRWVIPSEILWLAKTHDKSKGLKEFIKFNDKNTCYGDLSFEDPMPFVGSILQSMTYLLDSKKRRSIFNRGWNSQEMAAR